MKATVRQAVEIPLSQNRTAVFHTFYNLVDGKEHIALVFGSPKAGEAPLVRMHSECLTGDVFESGRCDCGEQLDEAVERLSTEGGILLYLRQEGRGIGLYAKLDAYVLQLQGLDTYEANQHLGLKDDLRNYEVAAQMLQALGVNSIRLLSNNPDKRDQLIANGIEVAQMRNTGVFVKRGNEGYLRAKVEKTGHFISLAKLA